MEHGQTPCLGRRGDEEVDNRRAFVLTQVDQAVLGALDEAPGVIGHGMPGEERPEKASKSIAVRLGRCRPSEFRLDGRAHSDQTRWDGVNPTSLDVLAAA